MIKSGILTARAVRMGAVWKRTARILTGSENLHTKETIMWRRRSFGGWRRRRAVGTRRSGFGYSFGTVLLIVSGAFLLFLYLTGRLNL